MNKVIIKLCFPNWCSGDVDGIVPTTGTRYWLAQLDLPIQTPWYPWNHSSQVMYRLSTLCFFGDFHIRVLLYLRPKKKKKRKTRTWMGTSCIRKLMYYGMGMVGLILPRNMASLVGQANVPLGGNGFFQGLFQSVTIFFIINSHFKHFC